MVVVVMVMVLVVVVVMVVVVRVVVRVFQLTVILQGRPTVPTCTPPHPRTRNN